MTKERKQVALKSEYKKVWNDLSTTIEDAVYHVTGNATEGQLRKYGHVDAQKIIRKLKVSSTDDVLEIGCGVGRLGYAMADYCKKWIGCDISSNMINHARTRLDGKTNAEFNELTGNDLSVIESNSVDAVYCSVVFMHLEEWDRYTYVQESHRILRKGGRIYIDNFNLDSEEGWAIFLAHQAIPIEKREAQISKSSTVDELKVYLKRAGFKKGKTFREGQWVIATGIKK
jgi:ubiquinone/menaquinone biosynthesis C-methylase UbiE